MITCHCSKLHSITSRTTIFFYWGSSIYISCERSPELQTSHTHRNYLLLLEHGQTRVSRYGQSEAAFPTPGITMNTHSPHISVYFKETKLLPTNHNLNYATVTPSYLFFLCDGCPGAVIGKLCVYILHVYHGVVRLPGFQSLSSLPVK